MFLLDCNSRGLRPNHHLPSPAYSGGAAKARSDSAPVQVLRTVCSTYKCVYQEQRWRFAEDGRPGSKMGMYRALSLFEHNLFHNFALSKIS